MAGWNYQWISQLCFTPDSWTAPCDTMRIPPTANTTNATIDRVSRLVELLPTVREVPMFVFDAGYDPIAIRHELAATRTQILCRIRDDRVFHHRPPPRPNRPADTGGRPPRHGARHKCSDQATWSEPSDRLVADDPRYGSVTVTAWADLHPRLSGRGHWIDHDVLPIVAGTVIRVDVEHLPRPTARTKKTLWLWWSGPGRPDLDLCWRAYLRRFDIEHSFRFAKNTLGWTTPSICTPEQANRWTWLTIAAYTQLRLARGPSTTSGSHGNDHAHHTSSPQRVSAEGFDDFAHTSEHPPTHRNPPEPAPAAPKAPEDHPEHATQPSKRPPEQGQQG